MASRDELDWDDLRYFLRALQAGTLAGAARALEVEHSTVGRRLTALERALGVQLVLRGGDGLKLTAIGERVLPLAEEVESAVRRVMSAAAAHSVRVRLAVPSGFAKFFSTSLSRLRDEHPEITLELVSGARPVDLKRGEADLALRHGPVHESDLIARKLCESGWSLYAAEAYLRRRPAPCDLDDLGQHDVIAYDESLAALPAAQWIEQRASRGTVVLRSREMTEMLAAAAGGAGLALLPCSLADDEPGLRRLTPRVLATRSVSLVYSREAAQSKHVSAVIDFVLAVIHDAADRIGGLVTTAPGAAQGSVR
jgi:DNA-binding transcriptional LysR family regulator